MATHFHLVLLPKNTQKHPSLTLDLTTYIFIYVFNSVVFRSVRSRVNSGQLNLGLFKSDELNVPTSPRVMYKLPTGAFILTIISQYKPAGIL